MQLQIEQRQIQPLLDHAVATGASDLHMGVGHAPMLRMDGRLEPVGDILTPADLRLLTEQLLPPEQLEVLIQTGEMDTAYSDANGVRYRVNAFMQQGHHTLAIRIIARHIPSFASLALPFTLLRLIEHPHGLVLVTGPTGSGKTTTLAALVDTINQTQSKHIITLEDPIEYVHTHQRSIIHQREIGRDTSGFEPALRAALRQDPDVILVGELRDLETVRTAVTASETGHLVLATLHTGDAVQTVDRLIDMFPSDQQAQVRAQLSSVLLGVLAQQLVPRQGGQGRVALAELLINTPAVANLIRTQKTHQLRSIMQTSRQQGMQTFAMAAREQLQQNLIAPDVAKRFFEPTS